MPSTARLDLPFLSAGQAQKETTINEALQLVDFVTAGAVIELPRNDPPSSPAVGDCYIVGPAPTGAWTGWAGALAGYSAGGWRRVLPVPGMWLYVQSTDQWASYRGSAWEIGALRGSRVVIDGLQVVGPQLPGIAAPAGGSIVDNEARAAIAKILGALRSHGLLAD
jgi:hypothetical protein